MDIQGDKVNIVEKGAIKVLSIPSMKKHLYFCWRMYHLALLDEAKGHTLNETYRNIKKYGLDLDQDIPNQDATALKQVIQMSIKKDMTVIEVGSWKGFSTALIAGMVKDWNGKVYAIDHWKGNTGVVHHDQAKTEDILSIFRTNMKVLKLDNVFPMVMDSADASKVFTNESADFIFIDADHRYSGIMNDLKMWLPKLKKGGVISGHDCEEKYTNFADYKLIDEHCEEDVIVGVCHAGVVKALYDTFGRDFSIIPDSSIWWKKI